MKRKEKKRKEYIVVLGSFLKPGQIETDAYWGIYFCVAQDIPRTTLALSPSNYFRGGVAALLWR